MSKMSVLNNSNFSIPVDEQVVINGAAVDPTTIEGPFVIEFSATWCGPCLMVFPHLNALSKKYQSVKFIQAFKCPENKVKATVKKLETDGKFTTYDGLTIMVTSDSNLEPWYTGLNIRGIPHAAVFAPGGQCIYSGHPAQPAFEQALAKAAEMVNAPVSAPTQ